MYFKHVFKTIKQNFTFALGQSLQAFNLPTDLPISKITVRLSGIPGGTSSGAGTLQNALWPAIANMLGYISIEGSAKDGTTLQVKNIPAGALWLRSYLMNKTMPPFTELTPGTPATACSITVPLHFMDTRLPKEQQILTALDARRYGGGNNTSLTMQIDTGNLQATTGALVDRTAIVGGTYANLTAGTLVLSVVVEQLQPMDGVLPEYDAPNALGFMDLALEYRASPALSQANSSDFPLNYKGIEAEIYWLDCDRDANQIETAVNNLGVTPVQRLVEKLGAVNIQDPDPFQLQDANLQDYLPAATVWPTGLYAQNSWRRDLRSAPNFIKNNSAHTFDLNMGPSSLVDSIVRLLHVTYNPSRKLAQIMGLH